VSTGCETRWRKVFRVHGALWISVTEPDVAEGVNALYESVAVPADSFANMVAFAMSQPEDVDVNEILYRPTAQQL
jgi:NADP-dependent 3-hydroxy acid dehydrogenase YdfG